MLKIQHLSVAALLLGSAPAVFAQTNVQLYGRINTSVEYQKEGKLSATGMLSNGSFLGLRGQEDLGAGLKAGFVLEAGLNSDDGRGSNDEGGLDFNRRSELNLQGRFGMLRMGTFDKYSYTVTDKAIAWHNDNEGVTQDIFSANNYRRTNSLAYRTPKVGGWDAEIAHHFGEKQVQYSYRNDNTWDLGVNYANGPWGFGLGLNRGKTSELSYGDIYVEKTATVRASYMGVNWAVGAYYQHYHERGNWVDIGNAHWKSDIVRVAGMYRWNASELHLNVGYRDFRSNAWEGENWEPYTYRANAIQWTLAYHYKFSPRTKAYVFYSHNDDIAPFNSLDAFNYNEAGNFRSIGFGMRHEF
ncbi:MAG: porin [Comamonas sp.]